MQYESVILELLSRIQTLEAQNRELTARLDALEAVLPAPSDTPENVPPAAPDEPEPVEAPPAEETPAEEPPAEEPPAEAPPSRPARIRLTPEMFDACYRAACRLVQDDTASFTAEIDGLESSGINRNSAIMYVYAVKDLLNGQIYKRAINLSATEQFFKAILSDFGPEGLKKALQSTRAHIAYRRELGHSVDSLEQLCDQYEADL